jgi:hypothetical protein
MSSKVLWCAHIGYERRNHSALCAQRRADLDMKTLAILAFALLMFETNLPATSGVEQEARSVTHSPPSDDITFHSSSDLVVVDVIALKDGLPGKTLKR